MRPTRKEVPFDRAFRNPADKLVDGRNSNRLQNRMHGSCVIPLNMPTRTPDGVAFDQEITVRCRGCPACFRSHQSLWAMRAEYESRNSPATIFFTGTFARQTKDHHQVRWQVQKYMKRLRAKIDYENRSKVRYMFVTEQHKSGMLHTHALIHGDWTMDLDLIRMAWDQGIRHADWADPGAAWYVPKYISKDLNVRHDYLDYVDPETGESFHEGRKPRMMASRAPTYGGPVMERDREVLQAMMRSKSPELTEDIWTKNLRMGMMEVEPETAKLYIALQNGTLSLSDYEQRLMN